jgi:hypothetical protein
MNMAIAERVHALALKIRKYKAGIETEEVNKNALLLPFISTVRGYEVFEPNELIPEFAQTSVSARRRGKRLIMSSFITGSCTCWSRSRRSPTLTRSLISATPGT